MDFKIRKSFLKDNGIILYLCVYFTTKLLWDSIPYFFELLSIGIVVYGAARCLIKINCKRTIFVFVYVLLSFYIIINGIFQDSTKQLIRALYEYIFYSFIFWATLFYGKKTQVKDISLVVCKIGLIVCFLSWIEYFFHCYLIPNSIEYANYLGFRSIVFSRTFLAHGMVLAFFSLLDIYMFLSYKSKKFLMCGAFSFLTILSTGSRGPLVACFLGILVMIIMNDYANKGLTPKRLSAFIASIVGVVLIWILLTSDFQVSNPTANYFLNRVRSILDWKNDSGNTGRIVIWNYYLNIAKEHYWFGIGPSQTGSWNLGGLYGVTESGILKRFCELGIVGLVLHYSFVIGIIFHGVRCYKKGHGFDRDLIFYFGLFVAVFVDDIILQATEEIIVAFLMWFALAGIENTTYRVFVRKMNNVPVRYNKYR